MLGREGSCARLRVESGLILIKHAVIDILLEYIYLGCRELASAHTLLEEHVQLCEGSTCGIRQSKVYIDNAAEAKPGLWSL